MELYREQRAPRFIYVGVDHTKKKNFNAAI